MRFFIKDGFDRDRVEIKYKQSGENSVLVTGTTLNYIDQWLIEFTDGCIQRYALPHDFIKESGIRTDDNNKIRIET